MSAWNPDTIAARCTECEREYVEYMRQRWEADQLAALDPEPESRQDFDEWTQSPDADRMSGPACPVSTH